MAVAVRLSIATTSVSMKGDAAMANLPPRLSAVMMTLVVCPGAITTVSVLKGLT